MFAGEKLMLVVSDGDMYTDANEQPTERRAQRVDSAWRHTVTWRSKCWPDDDS